MCVAGCRAEERDAVMVRHKGFTLIELLVVVAVIAILAAILMPVYGPGRYMQAEKVMCRANLRQWGLVCKNYTVDYDDKFPAGSYGADGDEINGIWWDTFRDYYEGEKLQLCLSAREPDFDGGKMPFRAYAKQRDPSKDADPKDRESWYIGSYGWNDWVGSPAGSGAIESRLGAGDARDYFWSGPNVSGASTVPLIADCGTWQPKQVEPADQPSPYEYRYGDSEAEAEEFVNGNPLSQFCMNRHNGSVNMLFMDLSVHAVGLKELWLLQWRRDWEARKPGWPDWMKDMEEY